MLTNEQYAALAEKYIDTVYRVAFNYLKSSADADDVTQNVFLKLLKTDQTFSGQEHARNWLIRVTVNECKNLVRSRWWRMLSLEDHVPDIAFEDPRHSEVYLAVMALPKKYRMAIYLHYFEEYTTEEIAGILKLPKNTVCTHLRRGRELLKRMLQEADNYD